MVIDMFSLILLALFVKPMLSTSGNVSKRLLLHGDQDVLTEFKRLSTLVDQLVKEKNESAIKLLSLEHRTDQIVKEKNETDTKLRSMERLMDQQSKEKNATEAKLRNVEQRTAKLQTSLNQMQTKIQSSGFVGGSWYGDKGGAANYVCLSKEPTWSHYDDRVNAGARIFGTEYEFHFEPSHASAYFGQDLIDDDAVCAVCETQRQTSIMIPGRNRCLGGWTEEYHGYLVAGEYRAVKATEYICLDERPEVVLGGSRSSDGNVFFMVEGICGSLPCPPYVNGREITCVVCSK